MTIESVVEHMKATNDDHVRCVLEPDEVMVVLDYLERCEFVMARRAQEEASFGVGESTESVDVTEAKLTKEASESE